MFLLFFFFEKKNLCRIVEGYDKHLSRSKCLVVCDALDLTCRIENFNLSKPEIN